jgi:hypothetical protein
VNKHQGMICQQTPFLHGGPLDKGLMRNYDTSKELPVRAL